MSEANITTSLANAINDHCRKFEASDADDIYYPSAY